MVLEGLLASVVLPAAVDLVKSIGGAVTRRFVGLSTDDQIKLDNAYVEKLKAVAALDNPYGTPSPWVVNLRASFRYIAAAVIISVGAAVLGAGVYLGDEVVREYGIQLVSYPFGFIFGERMYLGFKGPNSK